MNTKQLVLLASLAVVLALGGAAIYFNQHHAPAAAPAAVPAADTSAIGSDLKESLASYRKIIVLFADEKTLAANEREVANRVGQALFHENLTRAGKLDVALAQLAADGRYDALDSLLSYIESDKDLFDADRLAFREILQTLRATVAKDSTLPAIKLHKRLSEDLDALADIEQHYEKEIGRIFGRFEQRAIQQKRERWDSYLAFLKTRYSREQVLKDYGVLLPYPEVKAAPAAEAGKTEDGEIFGKGLPKKTIALSFDDGPHNQYTEEIAAILKQYNAPAVFFSVGRNLGSVDAAGKARLSSRAGISRKLMDDGFVLGNHSFSHAQLSKQSGDSLKSEIFSTDALLKEVNPNRAPLFRFPYGARNAEGMQLLEGAHLRSVMWNIDSLDWADPVPASIAERVLHSVEKEGRGIILFHDIHERTVKALPMVLERLVAEGYQFAGWDGARFTVAKDSAPPAEKPTAASTGYGNSWAIVIGIDDYVKWPKLQYAVQDSQAVRQVLIDKFGFAPERVFSLKNNEATRTGILATFHDRLAHGGVQKNDRIFVFFAGHGATRKLSSGRDLGYIVPADSDPDQFETDAIPMTEIQNIAESLDAKHVFFVMDSCYSGLGLTRGGGGNYLRENAKRIGRQMLTAGGADQLVADGGPNGHSIFTWTLLAGLGGKADLNGDGLITATELAAYIAPAVSSVSNQTPAFGSLPGSEGGDFVFELPAETEFIGTQTAQLSSEAIRLNSKLEATRPATATVTMKDLQGAQQTIVPPAAVPTSSRQLAQRANDRGLQLYKEKQYAAAEAEFTEALKLRPDFALAANNLGFVYYRQEKYREAARWYENALKMDPSRAIAWLNLGDALVRASDGDAAKKAFRTYLELAPNSSSAPYAKQQLDKL